MLVCRGAHARLAALLAAARRAGRRARRGPAAASTPTCEADRPRDAARRARRRRLRARPRHAARSSSPCARRPPRVPASVEKLYTTSTALLRFGPPATLPTLAGAGTPRRPGGPARRPRPRGGGDPFFGDAAPAAGSARAGARPRRRHPRASTAPVVGDETRFDALRAGRGTGYDPDRLGGVLSALAFDRGISAAARARRRAFAAAPLRRRAARRGVRASPAARAPAARPGRRRDARRVASPPSATLIRCINVPSNNFAAEMLLKDLGARFGAAGSTPAGAAVVRDDARRSACARRSSTARASRATTARRRARSCACSDRDGRPASRRRFRASLADRRAHRTSRRACAARRPPGAARKTGTLRASRRWPATADAGAARLRAPDEPRRHVGRPARSRTAWRSRLAPAQRLA